MKKPPYIENMTKSDNIFLLWLKFIKRVDKVPLSCHKSPRLPLSSLLYSQIRILSAGKMKKKDKYLKFWAPSHWSK